MYPQKISEAEPKKYWRRFIMSRFKKNGKKKMGAISTASLPDYSVYVIVFLYGYYRNERNNIVCLRGNS